jgi:NTP pyrophosphatase (non-canonical NTP hydrolase)
VTLDINLSEYQRQVREGLWIKPGVDKLSHCALGLTGEAGEVADLVKKSQYPNGTLNELLVLEEAGDTLWYLTNIIDQIGVTLPALALSNIKKLEARHGPNHYNVRLLTMVPA